MTGTGQAKTPQKTLPAPIPAMLLPHFDQIPGLYATFARYAPFTQVSF